MIEVLVFRDVVFKQRRLVDDKIRWSNYWKSCRVRSRYTEMETLVEQCRGHLQGSRG